MPDGLAEIYIMVGTPDLALPIIDPSLASPVGMDLEELTISPFWRHLGGNPGFNRLSRNRVAHEVAEPE